MTKTAEEIRSDLKEKQKKKKGGGKIAWFSLKPDTTVYVRVAEPWKKGGEFWKDVLTHGFYKDKVYCRRNEMDKETGHPKKCRVEKRLKALKEDRSLRGKKLWNLIRQREEHLWNVFIAIVKRSDSGKLIFKGFKDKRSHVWRLSQQWHDQLVEFFADDDYREKSILGITHPKYGRFVKVKRVGENRDDTKYTFTIVDEGKLPSLLAPTKEERIKLKKTITNLDAMVHGSSSEELDAFLEKMERLAKKQAAEEKNKKGRSDDEDEEEIDDEEEDTNDDGDDDEPRKKSKKSRDRDEEDDEDSGEDDGDDGDDSGEDDGDSDEDEDGDDLERKYSKMKKAAKKKHGDDEEDDE